MSIEPRHSATIIVSACMLRTKCMYCSIPSRQAPANRAANQAGRRSPSSPTPTSRYAMRPAKIAPDSEIVTEVNIHSHSS